MTLILKSPDNNDVKIRVVGVCRKCKHYHEIDTVPDLFGRQAFDWEYKHRLCEQEHPGSIEFLSPQRFVPRGFDDSVFEAAGQGPPWLDWKPNANVNISYVADGALTWTLSALATSSTFVSGRECTWQSNSSNYLDCEITGTFITGTSPTGTPEARVYYLRATEDTPSYPDVFDGTDSDETVTNTNILSSMTLGWSGTYSTTSNITYPVTNAITLAQAFGVQPKNWGLFFTHYNSGNVALKTDAANNNSFYYRYTYYTVA